MAEYQTTDLQLCAYLRAAFKLPLTRVLRERTNLGHDRLMFCLELAPAPFDVEAAVTEYFAGRASVLVRQFCDEVAALKGLIYSGHEIYRPGRVTSRGDRADGEIAQP